MRDRLPVLAFAVLVMAGTGYPQRAIAPALGAAGIPVRKLPDTGQTTDYTQTTGEDSDFSINVPAFTVHGGGTVTDEVTGLMWQRADGGEMTYERAVAYCDTLSLAGYSDWRLPTSHELFGIVHLDRLNPAMDTSYFSKTVAEYWWSADRRVADTTRIWVVNAGGGIGPHPKTETLSAGGTKRFHTRAVREPSGSATVTTRFQDNGDSTVTDLSTGLTWQKYQSVAAMTWEQALTYGLSRSLGGYRDWRVPNLKELQSLNDEGLSNPSVDRTFFPGFSAGKFWSSTSQSNSPTRAWHVDFQYGIATYEVKTSTMNVLCVRGGAAEATDTTNEALIPGGEFDMGDHFGFVDPSHPSDELPIHKVKVNAFYVSRIEFTNAQCASVLNAALAAGRLEVRGNCVFLPAGTDTLMYLNSYASYSSIGWNGSTFSVVDFRAQHPLVGVMWKGTAALCNWAGLARGLQECYNVQTWACDFTRNGFRLPTEAEWEYAGRGGQTNPYNNYPWGNDQDVTKANWPASGDPYETGSFPYTTPAGFYDGTLKQKAMFNWPGGASSYQTSSGANAFGLYDMAGNVWEFVNDWYGNNYYGVSPYDNPKGPDSGFIMPDGKAYRGMRGGNWYNGYTTTGVNDGHSRVSNRNPSYYRGPQDPNHPWYHVGFRMVRTFVSTTGVDQSSAPVPSETRLEQNFPNPFNPTTTIGFVVAGAAGGGVRMAVYDVLGEEVDVLVDGEKQAGTYAVTWNASRFPAGVYFCRLSVGGASATTKMLLIK